MLQKLLLSLILSCFVFVGLNAASYDIQLTASTQISTCYANGKILVKLSGADYSALQPSDKVTFDVKKNGVSYKFHDLAMTDIQAGATFSLEGYAAGAYTIDYTVWVGATEIKGSLAASVPSSGYVEPLVYQTLGGNQMMQGTRPTLTCRPTGRIQLEITRGKFPYTVQVFKDGVFLRNEVYASRMFSGTNAAAEDYRDYYNVEQLDKGSYSFTLTDSCGYQLTLAESIVVAEATFNCVPSFAAYSAYRNQYLSFSMAKSFFNNVKYDTYSDQWLEYRFALEGQAQGAWKPYSATDSVLVSNISSVQGKKYKFEMRVKNCPTYPVCYADVLIPTIPPPPPPPPCKKNISVSATLVPKPGSGASTFCACDGGTPPATEYEKWQVTSSYTLCDNYTLPLSYKWTNLDNALFSDSQNNINTAIWSYTSPEYPLTDDIYGDSIHIELTDAAGRVHKDTIIRIPPKPQPPQPTPPQPIVWMLGQSVSSGVGCNTASSGRLFIMANCSNIPDGATIEMNQTPNGYHFTGTYNLASRKWVFAPSTFTDFVITQTDYNASTCSNLVNIGFPSQFRYGNYSFTVKWRTVHGNDSVASISTNITNTAPVSYAVSQNLSFVSKKTCQGTIFYPKAQVVSWNTSDPTNKTKLPTKFWVSSGNATGYEINGGAASAGFCNQDSILITKPGRYIIQSYYSPTNGNTPDPNYASCTISTDSIDYDKQTLSFEDYYGFFCADSRGSTIKGSVTVIAKTGSGMPPYTYTLYNGKDANAPLVGSNATGVFTDLEVNSSQFYARIQDQCKSSFGVAIPMSPVIATEAIFGDRTVCLGSPANLQGKMIGSSNQVVYQWTSNNALISTNRQIITPVIVTPTLFSLEISGFGCRISDTITVKPVSTINTQFADTICLGTNYNGGLEYKNAITTAHLSAGLHSFSSGPFPAQKGGCDSISNLSLLIVDQNNLVEDTMDICDDKFPFFWQDSLFVAGTPSGLYTMNKQTGSCSYQLALRLKVKKAVDSNTQFSRTICSGDTVLLNGTTYNQSGSYVKHYPAQNACDSLVTLHLTVVSPDITELTDSIYVGESYNLNGFSFPVQTEVGKKFDSQGLKNQYACDSTVTLQLWVLTTDLLIPEVFSPNGDSKNAKFEIQNIQRYPHNHIMIFNRWGNKVYEGKPYMNQWDGKNYFNPRLGDDLPVGTYYYILDLGDGSEVKKGFIYLNR